MNRKLMGLVWHREKNYDFVTVSTVCIPYSVTFNRLIEMQSIDNIIGKLFSCCYFMGLWHRGDKATTRELRTKLLYAAYQPFFIISLMAGMITNENRDQIIFLAEASTISAVFSVKFWYLIWEQNFILELFNQICVFSIRNDDESMFVNEKLNLKRFSTFVVVLFIVLWLNVAFMLIVSFMGGQDTLYLEIGAPLDWRNSKTAFWIVNVFLVSEEALLIASVIFSVTIWHLLINCSVRYELLGKQLRELGGNNNEIPRKEREKKFLQNLIASIDAHRCTKRYSR